MRVKRFGSVLALALPLALWFAACSGGSRSSVSPSPVTADQAASADYVQPAKDGHSGGGDDKPPFEVEGGPIIKGGNCLTGLTLTGLPRTVVTTPSTVFKDISCADLATGDFIEAFGFNATGNLVAAILELGGVEIKGVIAATPPLSGACDFSRQFTVGTTRITTAGPPRPTLFEDVTCAGLVPGIFVEVKGDPGTNPLRARFIEKKEP